MAFGRPVQALAALALASAFLPVVTADGAADVRAELLAQGSAVLETGHDSQATAFGVVHDSRLGTARPELRLMVEAGTVRAVNFPHMVFRQGGTETRVVLPAEPVGEWQAPAVVDLVAVGAHQSIRVLPPDADAPFPLELGTGRLEFASVTDWGALLGRTESFGQEDLRHPLWPRPGMGLGLPGWDSAGDAFVFIDGGELRITTADGEERVHTGAVTPAVAGQPVQREDHVVLIVEGAMRIVLGTQGGSGDGSAGAWQVAVESWEGQATRLELQGVSGPLQWGRRSWDMDAALLSLAGAASVGMSDPYDGSSWTVAGSASRIGVDGQALSPGTIDGVAVAAAAASTATLTVLLVRFGKEILAVFGRNIARPMENDRRRKVLKTVAANPGWGRMEIARSLGLARTTVIHHLRVLKRASLIEESRIAKAPGYFLNSGSYAFATESQAGPPLDVQQAFVLLAQPTRRTIASLASQAAVSLEDLARRWPADRPSMQNLSYHCRILWKAGLLQREESGTDVRWRLAFDAQAAGAHQRRALLTQWGAVPVYDALRLRGPSEPAALAASLGDRPGTVLDLLQRLGAVGLVQSTDDGRYFVPEPTGPLPA